MTSPWIEYGVAESSPDAVNIYVASPGYDEGRPVPLSASMRTERTAAPEPC